VSHTSLIIDKIEWIYFVEIDNISGTVKRSPANNFEIENSETIKIVGLPQNVYPWHLDFLLHGENSYMLLNTSVNGLGGDSRLFICRQLGKNHHTYLVAMEIFPELQKRLDPVSIYKSSGFQIDDEYAYIYFTLIYSNKEHIICRCKINMQEINCE
jgi:hypothetical protein